MVSRSGELAVVDEQGREWERYKLPYGAMLTVAEGEASSGRVKRLPLGILIPIRWSQKWRDGSVCGFDRWRYHESSNR